MIKTKKQNVRQRQRNSKKQNQRVIPTGLVDIIPIEDNKEMNSGNLQQAANNRVMLTQGGLSRQRQKNTRKQRSQLPRRNANPSASILRLRELALSSYKRALIAPEYARDAKIPALFPLPTNSIHMKSTVKFNTNSSGNAAILVNPWFLSDAPANSQTFILINTDAALTLLSTQVLTTNFTAYSMGSRVSSSDATAYRLVSSSIHIYPEMSMQTAQGYIAGGIVTRTGQAVSYNSGGSTFNPFGGNAAISSIIDQALYYQKAQIGNQAGIRATYMPFDPTFEAFVPVGSGRPSCFTTNCDQFFWNYYVTGTQSTASMVMDIYYNFEIEPAQESVLQLFTTQHAPGEGTGPAIKTLTMNPELISQSSPNLLTMAAEIDRAVITNTSPSFFSSAINWISNNSGDIVNVVKSLAPLFA